MRFTRREVGLLLASALTLAAATGCSGVSASGGVSPASFVLPGLMQADPAPIPRLDRPSEPADIAASEDLLAEVSR